MTDGIPEDGYDVPPRRENRGEDVTRSINESADKIVLKTKLKRGNGTRDEDRVEVKVKGDDPAETADKLAETLYQLEVCGVAETLRETQPGDSDE